VSRSLSDPYRGWLHGCVVDRLVGVVPIPSSICEPIPSFIEPILIMVGCVVDRLVAIMPATKIFPYYGEKKVDTDKNA
jgi:hypothetical protein